jgi:hypothetical protein
VARLAPLQLETRDPLAYYAQFVIVGVPVCTSSTKESQFNQEPLICIQVFRSAKLPGTTDIDRSGAGRENPLETYS